MKWNARWIFGLALVVGAWLNGHMNSFGATSKEAAEAAAMMDTGSPQDRAAAAAREKDPAWKPSCSQVGLIQVGDSKSRGSLKNFCLDGEGNILACFAPSGPKTEPAIRVYSPKGDLLKTMPLEIKPGAISVAKDGTIFVAGDGKLLKLDALGKVLATAASPVANEPVSVSKEMEEMVKQSKRPFAEEMARMKTSLEKRRSDVTGVAVTDEDVFIAVPAPNDFTFRVYRFDHELKNGKLVVEKLRGCCGQMDVQSHDGKLWIPHNARHSVESRDRDGKQLTKFGKAGRVKANEFGGCCEPKNMRVLPNGDILAAESGPPTCIKLFSATGEFKGVVAVANGKGDCVRVTVAVSPDNSRYYLLDTTRDAIRIFGAKS